jgi:hypothetical protein
VSVSVPVPARRKRIWFRAVRSCQCQLSVSVGIRGSVWRSAFGGLVTVYWSRSQLSVSVVSVSGGAFGGRRLAVGGLRGRTVYCSRYKLSVSVVSVSGGAFGGRRLAFGGCSAFWLELGIGKTGHGGRHSYLLRSVSFAIWLASSLAIKFNSL